VLQDFIYTSVQLLHITSYSPFNLNWGWCYFHWRSNTGLLHFSVSFALVCFCRSLMLISPRRNNLCMTCSDSAVTSWGEPTLTRSVLWGTGWLRCRSATMKWRIFQPRETRGSRTVWRVRRPRPNISIVWWIGLVTSLSFLQGRMVNRYQRMYQLLNSCFRLTRWVGCSTCLFVFLSKNQCTLGCIIYAVILDISFLIYA